MTLLRTPLFEQHVAAGARMVPFAGFEMPVQYTGVREEHLRVRASVGLFDVSHMGEVRVRGPRAEDALSWLLSNATRRIDPGQAQYNVMCNHGGGVVDDVVAYRLARDEFIVCVNAANRAKDFAWMVANQPFRDDPSAVTFTDEGDDWCQIAVQGPAAAELVQALTDVAVDALANYRFAAGAFAGVDGCLVARTGYTGEDGFEVFAPAPAAVTVWQALLAHGARFDVLPIGLGARDTLRLEVRYCLYGHELDDNTSPLQAGLGWVTKLGKPGGFLGRDAILARQDADDSVLVGLTLDGKRIAREGMAVTHAGRPVGRVTSGTITPSVERPVALAYVPRAFSAAGTTLTVDVRGRDADAVVHDGPFYIRP